MSDTRIALARNALDPALGEEDTGDLLAELGLMQVDLAAPGEGEEGKEQDAAVETVRWHNHQTVE